MTMLLASVCISAMILITVDARSSYMFINDKPVIDLNRKPPPISFKTPHERRSALFPSRYLKFTLDSDNPRRIPTYSTPEASSESPLRKFNFNRKESLFSENTLRKFSRSTPKNQLFQNENVNNNNPNDNAQVKVEVDVKLEENNKSIIENSSVKLNIDEREPAAVNSDINGANNLNLTTFIKAEEHNLKSENGNNHPLIDIMEVNDMGKGDEDYSTQIKYSEAVVLPVENRNQDLVAKVAPTEGNTFEENVTEANNSLTYELNGNLRSARSVNIIEEENVATTQSGVKFTGRAIPISDHQLFRNINS